MRAGGRVGLRPSRRSSGVELYGAAWRGLELYGMTDAYLCPHTFALHKWRSCAGGCTVCYCGGVHPAGGGLGVVVQWRKVCVRVRAMRTPKCVTVAFAFARFALKHRSDVPAM